MIVLSSRSEAEKVSMPYLPDDVHDRYLTLKNYGGYILLFLGGACPWFYRGEGEDMVS